MRFITPVLACAVSCAAMAAAAQTADFYVSPVGRDTWSGRLPAPNRAKTDGPFATLEQARKAVRAARAQARRVIRVQLRGGTYWLKQGVVFEPEDSGSEGAPVVYEAYPGEKPVLSGGVRVTGWKKQPNGWWQAALPEVAAGKWAFQQLWADGVRRFRPRWPREGYAYVAEDVPSSPEHAEKGVDRIGFREGDIKASWSNLSDVEFLGFQVWTMARMRLRSVDEREKIATFTGPTLATVWYQTFPKGNRFLMENVREALGKPGEWYLDRPQGTLTYVPMPGETPEKTEVIAPRLERLVEFRGDPESKKWVSHIILRGLTFAHTNWVNPPGGNIYWQAEVHLGAAISGKGARDVRLEGCTVRNVGEYAVEFGQASKRNRVLGCLLADMGAGGVKIGSMAYSDNEEMVASHNEVRECRIVGGGRVHPAAIGVWIGQSNHNTIEQNEIADFYYTGISCGWTWGYGNTNGHHNRLARNHIHRIGQGVLSDMGGIYTLGIATGTVLTGNHIHDVYAHGYGGWGIYPDEGSTQLLIEDNVVYRCKSAGFHQHYGRENLVRNNIFAYNLENQVMRTRAEDHISFTFERNIVAWKTGALLGSNWSGSNYRFDHNLYWNATGAPPTFAGLTLEQWREKGMDRNSIVADPLFVAPEKGDFRLKPGSPASKIGFKPLDQREAGIPAASRWKAVTSARVVIRPAFSGLAAPPPPMPLAENFERYEPGEKPRTFTLFEEGDQYVIRVTDETAAIGRKSLRLVDGPQQHTFNPHIFYDPNFLEGRLEARFWVRMEAGAHLYHEWRDYSSPYNTGPSVAFREGAVYSGNQRLADLPNGVWAQVTLTCVLGARATGKFDLRLEVPGRPALVRRGLPCNPEFRNLRWFGFVMDGQTPAVAYLDDIVLKRIQ